MTNIRCFNIKVGNTIYPKTLDLQVRLNPNANGNDNRNVIKMAIQRAIQKRVTDFSFRFIF